MTTDRTRHAGRRQAVRYVWVFAATLLVGYSVTMLVDGAAPRWRIWLALAVACLALVLSVKEAITND